MSRNVSTSDRIIRLAIALVFIVLFMGEFVSGAVIYLMLSFAAILFITSLAGVCPFYIFMHIRTKKQSS